MEKKGMIAGGPVSGYVILRAVQQVAKATTLSRVRSTFSAEAGFRMFVRLPTSDTGLIVETASGAFIDTRELYSDFMVTGRRDSDEHVRYSVLNELMKSFVDDVARLAWKQRRMQAPELYRTYCVWHREAEPQVVHKVPDAKDGRQWECRHHGYIPDEETFPRLKNLF